MKKTNKFAGPCCHVKFIEMRWDIFQPIFLLQHARQPANLFPGKQRKGSHSG